MKTILIVDDEQNIHFAFQRVLGDEYRLEKATTAEDGLVIIEDGRADLVIMDISLPGMSGLDALQRVRDEHPLLPVIVMTAFTTTRHTIEAMKLGAYEYFTKPPEMDKMRESIQQALDDAEQRQDTSSTSSYSVPASDGADEPVNMIATALRENLYSEVTHEEVLDSIGNGDETTRVYSCFKSRENIKQLLKGFKEADEGISIMVSGLVDRVRDLAAEVGLSPHTINLSLGIQGNVSRLPPPDIRQFTTMCGHGVVSPHLVRDHIRKVKTGRTSTWDASVALAKPCACGIYNPYRSKEMLDDLAPVYTVSRW